MIRRKIITKADDLLAEKFVAEAKILDGLSGQHTIWNRKYGALRGTKARRAQADIFDCSGLIVYFADVTNDHDFVKKDGDAAKYIFEGFLGAETQSQAADADAGECRGDVNTDALQNRRMDAEHLGRAFGEAGQLGALREIERRVLWLSTAIIHEAN